MRYVLRREGPGQPIRVYLDGEFLGTCGVRDTGLGGFDTIWRAESAAGPTWEWVGATSVVTMCEWLEKVDREYSRGLELELPSR